MKQHAEGAPFLSIDWDLWDDDGDPDWGPFQEDAPFLYFDWDLWDDDGDPDWEPPTQTPEIETWFCVNCVVENLGREDRCRTCEEPRGFEVSKELVLAQDENARDLCSQILGLKNSTAVGYDEGMLLHSEVHMRSRPHPERPARLQFLVNSLEASGILARCFPFPAREISREELLLVHSLPHIKSVELTSHSPNSYFLPDTYANPHSERAARLAAGICYDLAQAIFHGHHRNGFALVRPPGNHAGSKAMGYCLYNNAAIAAHSAEMAGASKVLIVDWGLHHGNGIQKLFQKKKSVLYISFHRYDEGKCYPRTGGANMVGTGDAEGYCVNIPWNGRVGDADYIFAFQSIVLPIALEFAPDFTIIAAGFDAAKGDPFDCCDVTPAGFAQMTKGLTSLSNGKLLAILEGGYNLRSLSSCVSAVIRVLLGDSVETGTALPPSELGEATVQEVCSIQQKYWKTLRDKKRKR